MKRKRRTKAEMEAARSATANVGFRDIFDVLDNVVKLALDIEEVKKKNFSFLEEPQDGRPRCRFILKGYTPYMSTIATDGFRLISDGNKNKVNMRDFTMQED